MSSGLKINTLKTSCKNALYSQFRAKHKESWKIKYKTEKQEPGRTRTPQQRLMNTAKGRIPFDKRLVLSGKDVGPSVVGGSVEAQERVALHLVQPTGYIDKNGKYREVKEMIPEFVVPDLSDFKLKPYVPYKTSAIHQSKFTAKDLFDACLAGDIKEKFDAETGKAKKGGIVPVFKKTIKGTKAKNS